MKSRWMRKCLFRLLHQLHIRSYSSNFCEQIIVEIKVLGRRFSGEMISLAQSSLVKSLKIKMVVERSKRKIRYVNDKMKRVNAVAKLKHEESNKHWCLVYNPGSGWAVRIKDLANIVDARTAVSGCSESD